MLLFRVGRDSTADKPGAAAAASSSSNGQPQPLEEELLLQRDREAGETALLQQLAASFAVSSAHPRSVEMSLLQSALKVRQAERRKFCCICPLPPAIFVYRDLLVSFLRVCFCWCLPSAWRVLEYILLPLNIIDGLPLLLQVVETLLSAQGLAGRWPETVWGQRVSVRLRDLLQLLLGVGTALASELPPVGAKKEGTKEAAANLVTSLPPTEVWGRLCLAATSKLLRPVPRC